MKSYYNIHNLVSVVIETENTSIIKDYEYYLRHFKVDALSKDADVHIRDLAKFSLPENAFSISNQVFGFAGGIFDAQQKYALKLQKNRMALYLKDSNL